MHRTAMRRVVILMPEIITRGFDCTIHPLGIFFWGATATLGAWCELREDFRNFRLDRIESLELLNQVHAAEPGRGLHDYYAAMAERYVDGTDA